MNLHIIKPYDDSSLKYNENKKRYFLTREYCKDNFDYTIVDDKILDREIKRNTNNVYDFIYSKINTNNTEFVNLVLNNTKEGREFILQALSYQMEANIENAFNSTGKMPLVSGSGQVINRDELMKNQITVETERFLMNSATFLGINIFYQGALPSYFYKEKKL